jgi:hypothetical protein
MSSSGRRPWGAANAARDCAFTRSGRSPFGRGRRGAAADRDGALKHAIALGRVSLCIALKDLKDFLNELGVFSILSALSPIVDKGFEPTNYACIFAATALFMSEYLGQFVKV